VLDTEPSFVDPTTFPQGAAGLSGAASSREAGSPVDSVTQPGDAAPT
jgi:hypothetical protein